jgi:hypothetical protein
VEVFPLLTPQWRADTYAAGIIVQIRDYVSARGPKVGLPHAEIEAWWDDQQALILKGEFFFSLNRYLFLAER